MFFLLQFLAPSPIDGGWTDWSDWTPCPPCAQSVTSRSRTCTDPAPAFGGRPCDGFSSMDQHCPTDNNCVGKFCSMFIRKKIILHGQSYK